MRRLKAPVLLTLLDRRSFLTCSAASAGTLSSMADVERRPAAARAGAGAVVELTEDAREEG
jgi:hypothetical protein